MEYVYIFSIIAIGGVNLIFSKIYQTKFFVSAENAFKYPLFLCLFGLPVYVCLAGFAIEFSVFSFAIGVVSGTVNGLLGVLSLYIMRYNMQAACAVFTQFFSLIIPFVYGAVFLNERISPWQYAGFSCMLIAVALLFTRRKKEKTQRAFVALCILSGCVSGLMSVISKYHQISPYAVETNSYLIYVNVGMCLANGTALAVSHFLRRKRACFSAEANASSCGEKAKNSQRIFWMYFVVAMSAWLGAASSVLSMTAQKTVAATVLFPMTTGGSLAMTAIVMRVFFKEKITPKLLSAMLFVVAGLILYVL